MKESFTIDGRRYSVEVRPGERPGAHAVRVESDDGFETEFETRLLAASSHNRTLEIDGRVEDLLLLNEGGVTHVEQSGLTFEVRRLRDRDRLRVGDLGKAESGLIVVRAHMPGKVVRLSREPGETVQAGDGLIVIEAMKMQNEIKSPKAGTLIRYLADAGGRVSVGDPLCEVE